MPAKRWLIATAALAIGVPVLAQESLLPPGPGQNAATPQPEPEPEPEPQAQTPRPTRRPPSDEQIVESGALDDLEADLIEIPPPVELPDHARRDIFEVGLLERGTFAAAGGPWGGASGAFLSTLLRRMGTPLASRWGHMAVRNALIAEARSPRSVHPVDWVAERAWLLLRMGEADAARALILGVDVDRFTPKMFQVAVQSALATADPSGLCPLEAGLGDAEPQVLPLVQAMCAALAGEPESAAAQIDTARRRGRIGGIDLVLAEKVVGASSDTGRAVTVEWEPVDRLNSWRFGLATATGLTPPERLLDNAPARVRAWHARAPLISPRDRLGSALVATGLGVFSSQSLIDLHSIIYDSTGPDELAESDAWQLRQAFVGRDRETRLAAMRRLWRSENEGYEREAVRALLGRAAARIAPDPELEADAPDLIASMLAAGYDREAARWATAIRQMDDRYADPAWAMLALAAPQTAGLELTVGRVNGFIGRDQSPRKQRSALLVAGLAGIGRIDSGTAGRLNGRYGLGIDRRTRWTRVIDRAASLNQPGSVAVLTGTGLQAASFQQVPAAHLFHAVSALRTTGQEFAARMIAAEALART